MMIPHGTGVEVPAYNNREQPEYNINETAATPTNFDEVLQKSHLLFY